MGIDFLGRGGVSRRTAAFSDYVTAAYPSLIRQAYLLTGNSTEAADLVQTVLTQIASQFQLPDASALDAYARRSLVNAHISGLRRHWRGEISTGWLPERAARDEFTRVDERDALARRLQSLPARQRAALVLRFYLDLSEAQAADILDCRPGTVKSLVSRGLDALRAEIDKGSDGADPRREASNACGS